MVPHQRRVVLLGSNKTILTSLGLHGLIHLWGIGGSGKTLFAIALASDVCKYSRVEWINTDGKKSFVYQLKKNLIAHEGHPENILVTLTTSSNELINEIHSLAERLHDIGLIVIDPITRVLDMARNDPTLWGREIVEDILPTLAGLIEKYNVDIVVTSECRLMEDSVNEAVYHNTITKWVDHDLHIIRDPTGLFSSIFVVNDDYEREAAILRVSDSGTLDVVPKLSSIRVFESVS